MLTACEIKQLHLHSDEFKNIKSDDFLDQARLLNENTSIEFCPEIYNQYLFNLSCPG